ncbi:isochorismate synthase [Planococcus salinarum]|uniref:isochorismate synthase n=1 Tax=Planococcus salinarum TaxID=622695 RepID=UPI000E3C3975|nr:isochorismate synthase [Planococcus salinarum]TAA69807.1 isochorismate synthase [Planococcus salinarum]
MNRPQYSSAQKYNNSRYISYRFYTETIEVSRMSALAFFEAGEKTYKGKRFFWQNPEKTFTLVGLGHAHVLSAKNHEGRFEDIKTNWQSLCKQIVNEESFVEPILFGGFSFDPLNKTKSMWHSFPEAYFVVPTFQLVIKNDRAYVSIHLITKKDDTFPEFEALRKERDKLIHAAQVSEPIAYKKPEVTGREELKKASYLSSIEKVTGVIKANQAEKVVIARVLRLDFDEPLSASSALYQVSKEQPESFLFGLEAEEQFFFGATPERLVKVEDRRALSTCLAGSIPRGRTVEQDIELGNELLNDPKNCSEHKYVVDMISKVFLAHCRGQFVPKKPKLMKVRDIQHLYTPVEGDLKPESNLIDLVRDLHPTPALGGEPRQSALSLIRQYETMNRGYYAAPVGWIDAKGDGEFAVAIRSALLDRKEAYLYAGGGIVEDSTPDSEYAETWVKFRPMLRALGGQLSDES